MNKEELLYHYFSKTLTPEQQMELESLLENDTVFLEQFTFEKNLQKSVKAKKKEELKAKLQGFEKELNIKKGNSKTNFKIWAIAASIALLFGFAWFSVSNTSTNFDDLYASNFKTYPNTVFSITRGDTNNTIERKAFVAYESGDFNTAQNYFIALKNDAEKRILKKEEIDFYLAMSYLNADKLERAKTIFETIIASKNHFAGESLWYLSLINIKEKDSKSAVKNLQELINTYSYNQEKAKILLKELD